jgi:hypothetical protein
MRRRAGHTQDVSVSELRTPLPARPRPATRAVSVPLPAAIVAGSLLVSALTLLAGAAPTYDPWAWIIWGREVAGLDLDTVDGPSWKPLPVVLTTVFSVFGEAAPELWVWVARAGALAALPLAFLLAARLAGRWAGVAAVAALVVARWWLFNGAMGNSEGLLVALALGAVLLHADGRRGWAFALAVGVGLLRPEAWPFLGLYGLWLLRDDLRRAGGSSAPARSSSPCGSGPSCGARATPSARPTAPSSPTRAAPRSPTSPGSSSSRTSSGCSPGSPSAGSSPRPPCSPPAAGAGAPASTAAPSASPPAWSPSAAAGSRSSPR